MITKRGIPFNLKKYSAAVDTNPVIRPEGRVTKVVGLSAEGDGMGLGVGSLCTIKSTCPPVYDFLVTSVGDNVAGGPRFICN